MKITPMTTGFGARIEDVDLSRPESQLAESLQAALLEYGLLVIPGQRLTPQEQIGASEMFGALEEFPPAPSQIAGFPQIFRVASRASDGHTDVGRYWHSDGSFRATPTPISLWRMEAQPATGGDTLFTDLQQAYRTLPDQLKDLAGKLDTRHRNGVMHPLVMAHPQSGVPGLYLNIGLTGSIDGMSAEDSAALMRVIDAHFSREGAVYRHQWQADDFVVADNFHVAHRATPLPAQERRILNRTTVRGDGAFWNKAPLKQAGVRQAGILDELRRAY